MLLRERRGVRDGVLGRNRPVGLDGEGEPIVIRALPHACLGDGEVGAAHRIVDRVHTHHVHRHCSVDRMLFRLDVSATLVHIQLAADLAVVLHREQQLIGIHDRHGAVRLDVAREHGSGLVVLDVQDGLVHVGHQHQRQLLQALDDLVHVLDHTGDRLMLVDDAIQAERPHRRPPQGREQHAPQRIPEGVAIAPLERLKPMLG